MYIFARAFRIISGVSEVAIRSPVIGLIGIGLLIIYGLFLLVAIKKKGIQFKALFISIIGALLIWIWTFEETLQCYDLTEGWHKGICIGMGFWGGIILSSLFFILTWAIIVLVYFIGERIFRRKNFHFKTFKEKPIIISIIIISCILGTYIYSQTIAKYNEQLEKQALEQSIIEDQSSLPEKLFRKENLQTYLGQLPKPIKIYLNTQNQSIYGTVLGGNHITLNLNSQLTNALGNYARDSFFDKYSDKIFYFTDSYPDNRKFYVFDLNKNKEIEIKASLNDYFVAGAYKRYVALQKSDLGGYGEINVLDTLNNNIIEDHAETWQSEFTQTYKLYIDGNVYALVLDQKKRFNLKTSEPAETNLINKNGEKLQIYLIEKYKESNFTNIMDKAGPLEMLAFSHYANEITEDNKPLLILNTKRPENVSEQLTYKRTFRVRNLFLIDKNTLAIEIDNGLAIIDLQNKKATYTETPAEIENLLTKAMLFVPPIANNFDYNVDYYCDDTIPFLKKDQGAEQDLFIFCLE